MTNDEVFAVLVQLTRDDLGGSALEKCTRQSSVKLIVAGFSNGLWYDSALRLNECFRIDLPESVWREALLPKRTKTIGGVCDLIAQHATIPVIEPVSVLGDRSLAAGAFLVIRGMFAELGADVSNLRPSSPLRAYLCENLDAILPQLIRVAPHRMPAIAVDAPIHDGLAWGFIVSFAMIWVSDWLDLPPAASICSVAFVALFWLAAWVCGRALKPIDVRFGDARTFRDLARILAGERCAFPGFPVIMK